MRYILNTKLFKESLSYSNKTVTFELCVGMLLINPEFLDNILDRGLIARYDKNNSSNFITDLKNLLLAKNRFKLGVLSDGKIVHDADIAKVNQALNAMDFDIEKEWNTLISARNTARNIIDKIDVNSKIDSSKITAVYWLGPNKTKECNYDLIIEVNEVQYPIFLNKKLTSNNSISFTKFADELLEADVDFLFEEKYMERWDKLIQQWVSIIYENSNKLTQAFIEKFIDFRRIESLHYFDFFDIKHSDRKYRHLGESFEVLGKNYLELNVLLTDIWANKDKCFDDPSDVVQKWMEVKNVVLYSKTLENIFTTSLKSKHPNDITKKENGFKSANGQVKQKLFKVLINKLGAREVDTFYVSSSGNVIHKLPSREYFRRNFDRFDIEFDYHVSFDKPKEDFEFISNVFLDKEFFFSFIVKVNFAKDVNGKLMAKFYYDLPTDFNYRLQYKKRGH